ncbi:unnamed protein product [Moneuplotes crassus]|uniref:Uncharacterized protein n=1 Tax=Euplotes crassus TaxID=5936 RepID=A0AAD1X7D5_EUPCR|nr:unnamed protein product [Moneuplotes crassus]
MEGTHEEGKASSPISLREYARHRLLEDMISTVKKLERANNDYLILVMDKRTRELFAGICSLFEIMSKNVFHLENLELIRKDFPSTPAIYFVTPTQSSIDSIIEDFKDPDNPQYASAHVFFSTKLSDALMDNLSQNEGLISRISSLSELNVDINLYEDNIFHLDQKESLSLFNMNLNDVETARYLGKIGLQIFTVCTVMNERPYIQYQGKSKLAQKVAKSVNAHFQDFNKKSPDHNFSQQRGTLLILDRSFDMTAPLLHDYAYECLVYESVSSAEEADRVCSEESKAAKHGKSEAILDRGDLVWHRYKTKHLANAMVSINNEISRFVQENKNINAIKKGDQLEVTDLKDVLSTMPKYQELLSMYSKHLNLCQFVDKTLKARKFIDLIRVEQLIISGVDDSGNEVTNKDIIKEINGIYKSLHPDDHIRLILLYFTCYEVSDKDAKSLISTLGQDGQVACENLKLILGSSSSGFIRRRVPVMDIDEFGDYSDRLASTEYEILKTTPSITKIAKSASEQNLDVGVFPFLGDQPDGTDNFGTAKIEGRSKFKGRARWRGKNKKDASAVENKLIIFVIGGLSHHELVALNKLQNDHEVDCTIVPGGNLIFTPTEFLEQLQDITGGHVQRLDGLEVDENSIIGADQIGVDFT